MQYAFTYDSMTDIVARWFDYGRCPNYLRFLILTGDSVDQKIIGVPSCGKA
jgi:hypothetical protein